MTTDDTAPVQLSFDDGVAQLRLNRPGKRNAMNLALQEGLAEALEEIAESAATALVVGAAGPHFCVGADLDVLASDEQADASNRQAPRMLEACERFLRRLRTLPMPSIMAVEGAAAGGGAALALAGDLRVMGRSAKLYGSTLALGMTPDAGMSWFLSRAFGPTRATALLLRNTPMDTDLLASVGLVDAVVDDGTAWPEALALAAELGPRTPPLALTALRELMASASSCSLDQQLERERHWVDVLGRTEDFAEGVSAFLERRAPEFRGK